MATSSNSSIVILFVALSFLVISITPISFAFGEEFAVSLPSGTSVPGCEETNSCFLPDVIKIDMSDTVTWVNDDTAAHTVTSGTQTGGPSGVFDSSMLMAGDTFSFAFNRAGTFDYFCMVHPWMVGTIIVADIYEPEPTPYVAPITVTTDKTSYRTGDLIKIGGVVTELTSYQVTIRVTGPTGNFATGKSVDLVGYTYALILTKTYGLSWEESGTYIITAIHGTGDRTAETSFWFDSSSSSTPPKVPQITVYTDSSSYENGDKIIISGSVGPLDESSPDMPVTVMIIGPDSNLVAIAQEPLDQSGKFSHAIRAGFPMQESGVYEVVAHYGTQEAFTTFSFTASVDVPIPPKPEPAPTPAPEPEPTPAPEPVIEQEHEPVPAPTPEPSIPSFVDVLLPEGSSVPGCEDTDECYIPSNIRVDRGDTVTWYNGDSAAHTVTSGTAADGPDGIFDSNLFMAGDTYSWFAGATGEYPYFCMVHPWMIGVVNVESSSQTSPSPIPSPTPAPTPAPTQNDDLSELVQENKKLREELERQGEQIDELNEEVDMLKQIIQSIQGFFGSIFG